MKKFICVLLCLALCPILPVGALEYETDVSPAIEILRNQTKLRKSTASQSNVSFSRNDFRQLLGKGATHVTILDLPQGGALHFDGVELEQGQTIAISDAERLRFVSASQGSILTEFHFKDSSKTNACAMECILSLGEEKTIDSNDRWMETYRDCMTQITLLDDSEWEAGWTLHFCSAPSNGLLSTDGKGTVRYAPQTGFEGTDGFRYQLVHQDGRSTPEADVRIRINAPYRDVFFANLKRSPLHAMAVDFCKFTSYEPAKDENGTYLFDLEATFSAEEVTGMLEELLRNGSLDLEVFENQEEYRSLAQQILTTADGGASEVYSYSRTIQIVSYALQTYRK